MHKTNDPTIDPKDLEKQEQAKHKIGKGKD